MSEKCLKIFVQAFHRRMKISYLGTWRGSQHHTNHENLNSNGKVTFTTLIRLKK